MVVIGGPRNESLVQNLAWFFPRVFGRHARSSPQQSLRDLHSSSSLAEHLDGFVDVTTVRGGLLGLVGKISGRLSGRSRRFTQIPPSRHGKQMEGTPQHSSSVLHGSNDSVHMGSSAESSVSTAVVVGFGVVVVEGSVVVSAGSSGELDSIVVVAVTSPTEVVTVSVVVLGFEAEAGIVIGAIVVMSTQILVASTARPVGRQIRVFPQQSR